MGKSPAEADYRNQSKSTGSHLVFNYLESLEFSMVTMGVRAKLQKLAHRLRNSPRRGSPESRGNSDRWHRAGNVIGHHDIVDFSDIVLAAEHRVVGAIKPAVFQPDFSVEVIPI